MTKLRDSGLLSFSAFACMLLTLCVVTTIASPAQVTFTPLASFDGTDGRGPNLMTLTQGADGIFYGTTVFGGTSELCFPGCGTVFKVSSVGTLTTLHSFCSQSNCSDGEEPVGTLVQDASNNFYGITSGGGSNPGGTVFKITPAGVLTTVYSFCTLADCTDGQQPFAGLAQSNKNGNFYGTTALGGVNGGGTVFQITPAGKLTTLYSFCALANCADGEEPVGTLVQARDGSFYGEASAGGIAGLGTAGCGTIFRITLAGKLTTLFTFDFTNGCGPSGGLIQANNGDFYGVTASGGSGGLCQASENCGTAFKITAAGELTTLHDFCTTVTCADGAQPFGPLIQGTDGKLYGTTFGEFVPSTIFDITPSGYLATLFTFGGTNGYEPTGGLLQATSGFFYGTTFGGGSGGGYGTIFSLSTGLGPFVQTEPTSAKEGATIGIFGQGFTSSSVVEFGGVQATSVKVPGTTFLTATVPVGALTGSVTVTTGGTTLTTNQEFHVTPQLLSFNPPSGPVGTQVTIAGAGFTQASGVGFGDTVPAEFTVNSDTEITATVPNGAQTGPIEVGTKGGTAISSATFTVN